MSVTLTIPAQKRDPAKNKGTGSRAARKLRLEGRIPAILYGHKQDNVPLSISNDDIWKMIKRQSHITELSIDGKNETAQVRHIQWDHLGRDILHVDFARVDKDEVVVTSVPVLLRGETPAGGIVEIVLHEVKLDCPVLAVPDAVTVDLATLSVGQAVHARELPLPAGTKFHGNPDTLVLHVISRAAAEAAAATEEAAQAAQPEVIKKAEKKGDEKAAEPGKGKEGAKPPAKGK